jgi:tRNA dimethylallyltransferase
LQAIGYRHLMAWLEAGEPPGLLDDVIAAIKRDTRRYAKRQLTWFRREPGATWLQWSDAEQFARLVRVLCRAAHQLRNAAGIAP